MRPEDVVEELRKQPFVPFRMHLTDGTTYEIRHPELAMVLRSKVLIGVPGKKKPEPAERYDVVSLLHVMRLTPLDGPAAPAAG